MVGYIGTVVGNSRSPLCSYSLGLVQLDKGGGLGVEISLPLGGT